MDNGNKKKLAGVIVPVVLAILVVCGFAVSGHITRNMDSEMPTAEPQTEEITTQQTTNAVSSVSLVAVGDNPVSYTHLYNRNRDLTSQDFSFP